MTTTMQKFLLSMAVALVAFAGTAQAEESISADTLAAMGLSNLNVISDTDALAVRGFGFSGGHMSKGCKSCGARGKVNPLSRAAGASFATIGVEDGGAHTENSYFATGPYGASGENYSEAASSITNVEVVNIDGVVKTLTTTCITKVYAGGSSSSMSF
jgi:hypothetical protein